MIGRAGVVPVEYYLISPIHIKDIVLSPASMYSTSYIGNCYDTKS